MLNKAGGDDPPSYDAISPSVPVTYQAVPYTTDTSLAKGVPPGLQYLLPMNQLLLHEKFTTSQGWGRSFDVLDMTGQRIYQALQIVQCCGPIYNLKIRDNGGQEVLEVMESCGCRCSREMEVIVPSTRAIIGSVTLHWNTFVTHLSVMNPAKEVVLLILGPSLQTNIFGNVTFEVKSRDEQHVVGMIRSDSNQYTVTFPVDLEVSMKALVMASAFYLDSLIYSKRRDVANRRNSH